MLPGLRARPALVWVAVTSALLIALFALQWRSLNRFELATAGVLRQNSVRTAEAIAQQIQRDFKSPTFNLLEQIDHNDVYDLRLEAITAGLRARAHQFPLIDRFFIWSRKPLRERQGSPTLMTGEVLFFDVRRSGAGSAQPLSGVTRDDELSTILRTEAQAFARYRNLYALSQRSQDGRDCQVVYHLLYETPERPLLWAFLGFLTDSDHLRSHYFPELHARAGAYGSPLAGLPSTALSIIDAAGVEVFRSKQSLLSAFEGEARFPFLFFDVDLIESLNPRPAIHYWTVRTAYDATTAAAIASRESAAHRLLWLTVAIVATAGIVLSTRASFRETRLSEMKSEFVASVSHELKTPLAKILLFAETLASGRAPTAAKADEYYRIIIAQARKLSRLIGALLDFGRIEAGVRQYPVEEVDLRDVLQDAFEAFEQELTLNHFTCELVVPDHDVPVLGNAEGLQQLFENLISNALKYSGAERALKLELHTDDSEAIVDVTDRGVGIPRREHRRIFQRFYRGADATARNVAGSGVGLSIVEHVVRGHGGRVTVQSTPGAGSRFRVVLPRLGYAHGEPNETHSGDRG
ncbi:MAG: sensor histidine kinase [Vicinamibacterales bacterium]